VDQAVVADEVQAADPAANNRWQLSRILSKTGAVSAIE
jgi:hypothetical protein